MYSLISLAILVRAVQSLSEPCAKVSSSWAAQATAAFTRDHRAQVPAKLAFDCLMSVPVDVDGDLKEIEELQNFLQFQSTLSYLKEGRYVNNKVETHNEPIDLLDSLDHIAHSIRNDTYRSDFEVQLAIHSLFRRTGDFHLRFQPDMLEIFLFVRPESRLVSVSEDGISLPQLYLVSDLEVSKNLPDFVPSPLKTINGVDAIEYLEKLWTHNVYHDADARFNSFFPNPAAATLDMDSGGQFHLTQGLYDGPTTEFGFVNGSRMVRENVAMIREIFDFSGVNDGNSFFSRFCQGKPQATKRDGILPTTTGTAMVTPSLRSNLMPAGYPQPLIAQSGLSIQGYHLNGSKYLDVAVLALPNFQPVAEPTIDLGNTVTGFLEAQKILREFMSQSTQRGRTKLIIDLRGNSGGTIDMAFELFKQLFPIIEPFGASRFRAHEAFYLYSSSIAELVSNNSTAIMDTKLFAELTSSTANFANLLDIEGIPFEDFKTYYGPYITNNDTFAAARRYNFSNHLGGHTLSPHANLTGYDSSLPNLRQPFRAEDMVILQDGFCGSACAIFSQLMREQGHVQTIAIGGRPQNEPMQGVGGTKGAQLLKFDSIIRHMNTTLQIASLLHSPEAIRHLLQTTAVGRLLNTSQLYIRSAHLNPDERIYGAVNSLDNLRQNDPSGHSLEFVYEAADCRLFYTQDSFFAPVSLWEMAANVKWGDSKCVERSTGHATAVGVIRVEPFNVRKSLRWVDGLHAFGAVLIVITAFFMLLCFARQDVHFRPQAWTSVATKEV